MKSHKPSGYSALWSRLPNIGLLILSAVGIWSRAPQLISYPRFWAEEGSRYVHYALENGFWSTLFFLDPRAGYLDITRHFSAGLASLVPLVYAPYITTLIAFSIQLLACFIIIYGRSPLFSSYVKKGLGCLIVLFTSTVTDEVWLNTINSMTWYGLIGFLIAIDRLSLIARPMVIFYRIVLTIGVLSGPYISMLALVYGLIAIRERTRNTVINAGIVLGGLISHSLLLLHFFLLGNLNEKRFSGIDLSDTLYAMFWEHIAKPMFGSNFIGRLTDVPFGLTTVLGLLLLLGIATVWYAYIRRIPIWEKNWNIVVSWLCFSVGIMLTSMHGQLGGRYGVLPGWLVLFLLMNCARPVRLQLIGLVSVCFLSLALGIGLMNYQLGGRTDCDGRDWYEDVVSRSVSEPNNKVAICPQGWFIYLPPIEQ